MSYPPGGCRDHTAESVTGRWEEWYEVWEDDTGCHARARADGSVTHQRDWCALERELQEDFAARREQHGQHWRDQGTDRL